MADAPYTKITTALNAELIKYMGNVYLTQKVVLANLFHDLAEASGVDYQDIRDAVGADPRIGYNHLDIDDLGGRGAGGFCFIKDLAALREAYETRIPEDVTGRALLAALEEKNINLLVDSGKDIELVEGVYGAGVVAARRGSRHNHS